ncbi:carbohydrate ABC transporter permease [Devosia nitrariae]|uniref:Sugar ABC transporter permease n=1 Tax=Devosia nitrariae TaxID=2071872 RepID=A0ABQ5W7J8_9HYPH|nr:carbohydrate ABC transporter permease [Devosia nitrariae]GLQ55852.1 sugar ABC transporter permease [Devosia nitrariae]
MTDQSVSQLEAKGVRRFVMPAVLVLGALLMVYPLLWMFSSSLKPEDEIFRNLSLIPQALTFQNYPKGWTFFNVPFSLYFINSFVIAAIAIVGNLLSCTITAYVFARLRFRWRNLWFSLMLLGLMLPHHVTIIPQYIMFNNAHLVNTILPLVLPKFLAVDSFFVFLMVQFIRSIPRELDEAATMDGAGPFRVFVDIILPLCTPALVTVSIFTFVWTWNDFFSQLLYLTSGDKLTVPLALRMLNSSTGEATSTWGILFAMSCLSIIPLLAIFFFFQRRLVEGIATTGLKG